MCVLETAKLFTSVCAGLGSLTVSVFTDPSSVSPPVIGELGLKF